MTAVYKACAAYTINPAGNPIDLCSLCCCRVFWTSTPSKQHHNGACNIQLVEVYQWHKRL